MVLGPKVRYIFPAFLFIIAFISNSFYSCSKKKKIEPKILQVSPDVVWSGEDNQVEIVGKNFIEGAKLNIKEDKKEDSIFSVYLLGKAGKIEVPFSKENEEKVKAVIKKGTPPGNYEIFVEIGNGQKASYPIKVLRLPIPYIEKISRDKVSNISEQIIILEGKNFQEITKVYVGDREVEFSFSGTQVLIKIPPNFPPGDYEIKVMNSEGIFASYPKISVVEGAKIDYKILKPQNIFENSNAQVLVEIFNKGNSKAKTKISMNIDSKTKSQTQIEISPNETKGVNFDVFVARALEFEILIEGEDEFGGVFSILAKETLVAGCFPEICDGKDNDCDGIIDNGVLIKFYRDKDGDRYGDPNDSVEACSPPEGYVQNAEDCDDNDTFINPNVIWFKDADGDGFTDGTFQFSCTQPQGFVRFAPGGDCDDSDPSINPNQSEVCDMKDNNCNGLIDEIVNLTFYKDEDGDGYGNPNNSIQTCSQPPGYVQNSLDCEDSNPSVYPGAPLNCNNGLDNDCSGNIERWVYIDMDRDLYAANSTSYCVDFVDPLTQIPVGSERGTNDCDDNNPFVYPGAPLNCDNGLDNDCSGNVEKWAYIDQDGDEYAPYPVSFCVDVISFPGYITVGYQKGITDCDDNNPSVYLGAPLNCNNGLDNDCSGNIERWVYIDMDRDLYAANSTSYCVDFVDPLTQIPVGSELGTNDCNDNNPFVYPGAPLNCNDNLDNDCSGNIEKWAYIDQDGDRYAPNPISECVDIVNFPGRITAGEELGTNDCDDTNPHKNPDTIWYKDQDEDHYYPDDGTAQSCENPFGVTAYYTPIPGGDCDDENPNINPGKNEAGPTYDSSCTRGSPCWLFCNGLDDDCDGEIDEGFPPCDAPSSLTYTYFTAYSVSLQWDDNSPNDEEFVVEISTSIDFSSPITRRFSFPPPSLTGPVGAQISGLTGTQVYYFRVYARNATGETERSNVITAPVFFVDAVMVDLGWFHTCAIKRNGSLWCWGYNQYGQVGIETDLGREFSYPIIVTSEESFSSVSVGGHHTCAIKTDGSLWCWGHNGYGQVGDGTNTNRNSPTQVPGMSSGVSSISLGWYHSCAIKTDGSLWCWGNNEYGQLGDRSYENKNSPVQIMPSEVSSVSAGGHHTCAVKTDGSLWCWGDNSYGQIGNGTLGGSVSEPVQVIPSGVSSVSSGWFHTCAVKQNGSLWCWGDNGYGQLGNNSFGGRVSYPVQVTSLSDVSSVSLGWYHTCAIKTDGSLWCWGWNIFGQLGDGRGEDKHSPHQIMPSGVSFVSLGGFHTCAIKEEESSLWCWGWNSFGQLGDGEKGTIRRTPIRVIDLITGLGLGGGAPPIFGIKDSSQYYDQYYEPLSYHYEKYKPGDEPPYGCSYTGELFGIYIVIIIIPVIFIILRFRILNNRRE
jgi:alpha-tubulin suppressor-like RCC1 family protein